MGCCIYSSMHCVTISKLYRLYGVTVCPGVSGHPQGFLKIRADIINLLVCLVYQKKRGLKVSEWWARSGVKVKGQMGAF